MFCEWIRRLTPTVTVVVIGSLSVSGCGGDPAFNPTTAVVIRDTKPTLGTPSAPAVTQAQPVAAASPSPAAASEPSNTETTTAAATQTAEPAAETAAPAAEVKLDAGGDAFGTIKGRLVWKGGPPTPPVLVRQGDGSVKDAAVCSYKELIDRRFESGSSSNGVPHVFAYLTRPQGSNPVLMQQLLAQKPVVTIDQKYCEYIPFSAVYVVGQELELKSSDPVNHNVRYAPLANRAFNQILPPNGSTKVKLTSPERRPTELKCDIHPWMSGWFMALDHPFADVSDENGEFEIVGVPPGTQSLIISFPNGVFINEGRATGQKVVVKAGEVTDLGTIEVDPGLLK
jgi:hypothetical protein